MPRDAHPDSQEAVAAVGALTAERKTDSLSQVLAGVMTTKEALRQFPGAGSTRNVNQRVARLKGLMVAPGEVPAPPAPPPAPKKPRRQAPAFVPRLTPNLDAMLVSVLQVCVCCISMLGARCVVCFLAPRCLCAPRFVAAQV